MKSPQLMNYEELLTECARRAVDLYASQHPRPVHVNSVQAGEMLNLSPATIRKMVKDGRIALNNGGLIPIAEIDKLLVVKRSGQH